jgi:Trk K+ transport system NAD-binding subunit
MTQKLQEAKSYRVISEVNKLKHYILIYGYGKMGKVLASELHGAGEPFVIVDEDEVRIEEAKAENYLALQADINAQRVLEDLRCEEKVEYAVILGHSDVSNLSTILSLKALSPSMHIFARCNDHAVKNKLEFAGAKEVIYPYATAAHVGIEHIEKGREDKRVIIYGYAKTAHMILEAFDMRAKEVLLVVPHETKAIEARKAGFEVEVLNLAVDENLHKVGIGEEKDEVLFCLSRDFEQNLFVTLSARALDSKLEIISLCATESEAKKMKLAGANHTINPYEIGSKRIERLINKERKEHLIAK